MSSKIQASYLWLAEKQTNWSLLANHASLILEPPSAKLFIYRAASDFNDVFQIFQTTPSVWKSHFCLCVLWLISSVSHGLGRLAGWVRTQQFCLLGTHALQVCVCVKVIHITAGQGRAGCVLGGIYVAFLGLSELARWSCCPGNVSSVCVCFSGTLALLLKWHIQVGNEEYRSAKGFRSSVCALYKNTYW